MTEHIPYPTNVPGEFYVEDGCCTMCEVPFAEAPNLFGTAEDPNGYSHCYVKRQPESPQELDQMVRAIRFAELQCIRYRGADRLIQLRLIGVGEGKICDGLPLDLQQQAVARHEHLAKSEYASSRRPWWRFWS